MHIQRVEATVEQVEKAIAIAGYVGVRAEIAGPPTQTLSHRGVLNARIGIVDAKKR